MKKRNFENFQKIIFKINKFKDYLIIYEDNEKTEKIYKYLDK